MGLSMKSKSEVVEQKVTEEMLLSENLCSTPATYYDHLLEGNKILVEENVLRWRVTLLEFRKRSWLRLVSPINDKYCTVLSEQYSHLCNHPCYIHIVRLESIPFISRITYPWSPLSKLASISSHFRQDDHGTPSARGNLICSGKSNVCISGRCPWIIRVYYHDGPLSFGARFQQPYTLAELLEKYLARHVFKCSSLYDNKGTNSPPIYIYILISLAIRSNCILWSVSLMQDIRSFSPCHCEDSVSSCWAFLCNTSICQDIIRLS